MPDQLEARVEALKKRGELALAEEYRQLWEILCGGLEQCAALLGERGMDLEEFAGLFRLVLSQYDVGTIPVSLDRVTAGETTRQTGHRVKALFLLGRMTAPSQGWGRLLACCQMMTALCWRYTVWSWTSPSGNCSSGR